MTGSTLSIPELFHHAGLPEGHGAWETFRGETQLVILGPRFDTRLLERWGRGMTVEINNRRGLVRLENDAVFDGVDTLRVDTEEGLTRLRGRFSSRNQPPALSWEFPLFPDDNDGDDGDVFDPQPLTTAHLRHDTGAPVAVTQLLPRREALILGRAEDADLQLRLFPLDVDQLDISRRWVKLVLEPEIQVQDIRERGLDRGTRLDDTPLGVGAPPRPWLSGQTLILRDRLGLRYSAGDGWLRLTRTLNGEDREDYLILHGEGYPLGGAARILAEGGGFLLRALGGGVSVNGKAVPVGMYRGLWDGDALDIAGRRLGFHAGRGPVVA